MIIDFSRAHLWDASAIAALDALEGHYRRHDVELAITGLNERSDRLHQKLSGSIGGLAGLGFSPRRFGGRRRRGS